MVVAKEEIHERIVKLTAQHTTRERTIRALENKVGQRVCLTCTGSRAFIESKTQRTSVAEAITRCHKSGSLGSNSFASNSVLVSGVWAMIGNGGGHLHAMYLAFNFPGLFYMARTYAASGLVVHAPLHQFNYKHVSTSAICAKAVVGGGVQEHSKARADWCSTRAIYARLNSRQPSEATHGPSRPHTHVYASSNAYHTHGVDALECRRRTSVLCIKGEHITSAAVQQHFPCLGPRRTLNSSPALHSQYEANLMGSVDSARGPSELVMVAQSSASTPTAHLCTRTKCEPVVSDGVRLYKSKHCTRTLMRVQRFRRRTLWKQLCTVGWQHLTRTPTERRVHMWDDDSFTGGGPCAPLGYRNHLAYSGEIFARELTKLESKLARYVGSIVSRRKPTRAWSVGGNKARASAHRLQVEHAFRQISVRVRNWGERVDGAKGGYQKGKRARSAPEQTKRRAKGGREEGNLIERGRGKCDRRRWPTHGYSILVPGLCRQRVYPVGDSASAFQRERTAYMRCRHSCMPEHAWADLTVYACARASDVVHALSTQSCILGR
ncbi:hypothetical protein DFP72DRAFT_855487 [Ephemerocybe angulata]|uniref:Uncharacterized protein n=1 Tax=Ephemerocybe angulata TaxID=980116 RepID=A0A8H6HGL0_9AGAR|nr:hypothetical protein DFP72DRAFT_855487 [Tulosesus angulatus]